MATGRPPRHSTRRARSAAPRRPLCILTRCIVADSRNGSRPEASGAAARSRSISARNAEVNRSTRLRSPRNAAFANLLPPSPRRHPVRCGDAERGKDGRLVVEVAHAQGRGHSPPRGRPRGAAPPARGFELRTVRHDQQLRLIGPPLMFVVPALTFTVPPFTSTVDASTETNEPVTAMSGDEITSSPSDKS